MHRRIFAAVAAMLCLSALVSGAAALTIVAQAYPSTLEAYIEEHPEVEILDTYYDDRDLIQDALSHSDEIDVYFLYTLTSTAFKSLRDRGYFLPLEDYPALLEIADTIYPEIREGVSHQGSIRALPAFLMMQPTMGVNLDNWEKLGLSAEQLPRTWAQFLRFLLEDLPELSRKPWDFRLWSTTENSNLANELLHDIENNYEAYRERNNYAFGYDTPEFREILDLFQKLNAALAAGSYEEAEGTGSGYLFDSFYMPRVWDDFINVHSLRLSFREEELPCQAIGLQVMAINPNSKHIDEAIALFQYLYENMDSYDKLELCPGEDEPVLLDGYYDMQEEYAEQMNVYRERIAACTDNAERKGLELEMNTYSLEKQAFFDRYKYAASPESIQQYRNEVEGILTPIYQTAVSYEEYGVVNEKREQFLLGHISADQYITELERRFVFSVLENQ